MSGHSNVASCTPKDIPGLWDVTSPDGVEFFCDLTTNQVTYLAAKRGWLLPEPSTAERAQMMADAGHRPEDFC